MRKLPISIISLCLILLVAKTKTSPFQLDEHIELGHDHEEEDDTTAEDEESDEQEDELSSVSPVTIVPVEEKINVTRLYYGKTEQFYEIGTRGPCPNNLKFLPITKNPNEKFGDCGCHQEALKGSVDYVPLIYHHPTETCYHLYQQGYCEKTYQWLLYNGRQRVECAPNPCTKTLMDPNKVLWFNGTCIERGQRCGSKETVYLVTFQKFDVVPSCNTPPIEFNYLANVTIPAVVVDNQLELECPRAQRLMPNGDCFAVDVIEQE